MNTLDEDKALDPPLTKLLSQYPGVSPPAGWEDKVRAAYRRRKRMRRLAQGAAGVVAVAATVIAMLFMFRGQEKHQDIEIALGSPEGTRSTGATATIRDWLVVTVYGDLSEVRIYHDDDLIMKCPGDSGCDRDTITTPKLSAGETTVVGFYGAALPSTRHLIEDVKNAREHGIKIDVLAPVHVH